MALAIMVMKSSARQHDRRWTRVKRLRVGREMSENQRCESDMSCRVAARVSTRQQVKRNKKTLGGGGRQTLLHILNHNLP